MKKKLLTIVISLIFLFSIAGCSATSCTSDLFGFHIKNNVTNEITNQVVDYGKISISDFEAVVETSVAKVEAAVIGVTLKQVTYINHGILGSVKSEEKVSVGSGVIYKRIENKDAAGILRNYTYYVFTNRHVISGKTTGEYTVYAYLGYDDEEIPATVVGYDEKVDIACIKFEYSKWIDPVEFADSADIKKGSFAIAIGNPQGYDYYGSATLGIVSNPTCYIASDTDNDGIDDFQSKYIQHDAAINPGNSGGGLFTIEGKLLGINSLKFASDEIDNMGFAIPIDEVEKIVIDYIEQGKEIIRPRLGVTGIAVRDLTPSVILANNLKDIPNIYQGGKNYGIYVTSVTSGGSLDQSGVQEHDIILDFDGEKITSMSLFSAKLNTLTSYQVGTKVMITYYSRSQNSIQSVEITLQSK